MVRQGSGFGLPSPRIIELQAFMPCTCRQSHFNRQLIGMSLESRGMSLKSRGMSLQVYQRFHGPGHELLIATLPATATHKWKARAVGSSAGENPEMSVRHDLK